MQFKVYKYSTRLNLYSAHPKKISFGIGRHSLSFEILNAEVLQKCFGITVNQNLPFPDKHYPANPIEISM